MPAAVRERPYPKRLAEEIARITQEVEARWIKQGLIQKKASASEGLEKKFGLRKLAHSSFWEFAETEKKVWEVAVGLPGRDQRK
jgi:hypothetical protein